MAYYIFDSNGYKANGPSIGGLRDIKAELTRCIETPSKYPQMQMFLSQGYATKPLQMKVECADLANKVESATVKDSLNKLSESAGKCSDIVILRDSVAT